ncbi:hypothetical protein ACT7CZ_25320, partial [Bacillus cereus]
HFVHFQLVWNCLTKKVVGVFCGFIYRETLSRFSCATSMNFNQPSPIRLLRAARPPLLYFR